MIQYLVDIMGPGGCINAPALVMIDALRKSGYQVEYDDWHGLDGGDKDTKLSELLEFAKQHSDESVVKIKVRPMPWGG